MSDEGFDLNAIRSELKKGVELSAEESAALEELQQPDHELSMPGLPATAATGEKEENTDIRTLIRDMSVAQKVKLAMFGNAVCRSLLVADRNKLVQSCALRNPKLQINEVLNFAKNTNLSDAVLRTISDKKEWMKDYSIKLAIVVNPKTPPDVALRWLRFVQNADLKNIARSKNVPQIVAVNAKKRLSEAGKH